MLISIPKINKTELFGTVSLPASKSISNRVLILNFLLKNKLKIFNLSTADDTKLLLKALKDLEKTKKTYFFDLKNAGTTYRFLTALVSFRKGIYVLDGSQRMYQRPIKPLVDALKKLGVSVEYLKNYGFPPLKIYGIDFSEVKTNQISIDAGQSSQFLSAILLVAPFFSNGLKVFVENLSSEPYVYLTIKLMKDLGIKIETIDNLKQINVYPLKTVAKDKFFIEADWSSANYWYALLTTFQKGELFLKNLKFSDYQPDEKLKNIFSQLGIKSEQKKDGILIKKLQNFERNLKVLNLNSNPDLVPTLVAVYCFLGIPFEIYGVENLRLKESNRLEAMKFNLERLGYQLDIEKNKIHSHCKQKFQPKKIQIKTFDDHRIAMSFSIFAKKYNLEIDNSKTVEKSYPNFWQEFFKVIK